ncbi:MAG: flavodoxin family protein [Oscillospiraceae bacterium]|nr:flavodoxin family protein [Oscillospiraceae bacterium]
MKIIAINGSPKENGSTGTALKYLAGELLKHGVETEIIHVGSGPVQGCTDCGGCRKNNRECVFGGGVNEAARKISAADGLVIGAPVYYGGIAGGAKSFYDRLFFKGLDIKLKVCAAVTATRRSGGSTVYNQLNNYFTISGGLVAPVTYWNAIHGHNGEQIMQDAEGLAVLRNLAQSMAWLLKMKEATKDSVPPPAMIKDAHTNFIR